ncbi:unnamed protein product [Discula destructiva]
MQGFNMGRYVPPEHEGVLTANQASGKGHALGARAAKPARDHLTVRFEMPFAIWCAHCEPEKPTIIAQGVRFNAEKRRVGSYYSSAVWAFRMKHAVCGGWIEVRTDPQRTAYVVVEGGRRRDTGEGKEGNGDDSLVPTGDALVALATAMPREDLQAARETAFSTLEKTIKDRAALAAASQRIEELGEVAERQWDNPYARNAALRRSFRAGRKERERRAGEDEGLRRRLGGLGIDLVEETEEDGRRARLVEFGRRPEGKEERVLGRPLFETDSSAVTGPVNKLTAAATTYRAPARKLLKSEVAASKRKESLVSEIVGNTRMVRDPFLEERRGTNKAGGSISAAATAAAAITMPRLKRKRDTEREPSLSAEERPAEKVGGGLVDYDSD